MTDTSELCGAKTRRGFNQTTASGKPFWATDPRPEDVRIEDIAAQLSRVCRFGGALKKQIEVSQLLYDPHDHGAYSAVMSRPNKPYAYLLPLETYSVAQHSVLVADNVPQRFALRALLHDAAEAYIGDIIKPVKLYLAPLFGPLEAAVQGAILTRFGLPLADEEADAAIAIADYRAVLTEHRDLQEPSPEVDWGEPKHPPFEERIIPLLSSAARALFLQRFNELYKGE